MASSNFGYGCIIDAGSSGSRIYLYRWPNRTSTDGERRRSSPHQSPSRYAKVEREAVFADERNVGIHRANGPESLSELISAAEAALLSSGVDPGTVPIRLGATAGMRQRRRPASSATNANDDDVMVGVRSLLRESGFRFRDEWARTISGDEEGVYGWLVANYLRTNDFPPGNGDAATEAVYGALDLGGGSTQISCLAPASTSSRGSTPEEETLFPLVVGNVEYLLYTRSYSNHGADRARERHDARFVGEETNNPCYPIGYVHPESNVSGSSNWDECFESVATMLDKHSSLRGGPERALSNVIMPPPGDARRQRYIAMSVFVFVWDFLGLETGEATEDLNALEEKARRICSSTTLEEQAEQYDRTMSDMHPSRKTNKPHAQCFNAAYAHRLLSVGYGLPVDDTPVEVHWEIDGGKVNWALGMMLVEANNDDLGYGAKNDVGGRGGHRRGGHNHHGTNASKHMLFMTVILIFWMVRHVNGYETLRSLLRRRIPKGNE